MRTKVIYIRIPSAMHDALLAEAEGEGEQLTVVVRRRLRASLAIDPPINPDQQTQEESHAGNP